MHALRVHNVCSSDSELGLIQVFCRTGFKYEMFINKSLDISRIRFTFFLISIVAAMNLISTIDHDISDERYLKHTK